MQYVLTCILILHRSRENSCSTFRANF